MRREGLFVQTNNFFCVAKEITPRRKSLGSPNPAGFAL